VPFGDDVIMTSVRFRMLAGWLAAGDGLLIHIYSHADGIGCCSRKFRSPGTLRAPSHDKIFKFKLQYPRTPHSKRAE
jgi:hypothetical protein